MPKGTCNPFPEQFNVETLTVSGVTVHVRYGWDGVSTVEDMTGCDGPVEDIRYINPTSVTAWAILPRKARGETFVEIPPGTDQTVSGNLLRQAGLDTMSAVRDLRITTTPPA